MIELAHQILLKSLLLLLGKDGRISLQEASDGRPADEGLRLGDRLEVGLELLPHPNGLAHLRRRFALHDPPIRLDLVRGFARLRLRPQPNFRQVYVTFNFAFLERPPACDDRDAGLKGKGSREYARFYHCFKFELTSILNCSVGTLQNQLFVLVHKFTHVDEALRLRHRIDLLTAEDNVANDLLLNMVLVRRGITFVLLLKFAHLFRKSVPVFGVKRRIKRVVNIGCWRALSLTIFLGLWKVLRVVSQLAVLSCELLLGPVVANLAGQRS